MTATVVGSRGVRRIVTNHDIGKSETILAYVHGPSVIIPKVPSAPMKSLVVSKPAEHFLDLRRVLITSPEGRTTVYAT
jgi:hypothetical protein